MCPTHSSPRRDLFERLVAGDDGAVRDLTPLVYDELRALAGHMLRGEHKAWSLQPTALVHEAFVRIAGAEARGWRAKARFAAVAARAMREVLVDRARRRNASKRGGDRERVTITGVGREDPAFDVIALDDLLQRLARQQPRAAAVLEYSAFANMTVDEISEVLGVSPRTVDKDLVIGRGWVAREMSRADDD